MGQCRRVPSPFQALLDEHGSDVLGFLVASVGHSDAEDVFQETFIAALRAYPKLEHANNLHSWLLTIAHRKAIDHHRSRGRRAVPAGSPEEVAGGEPSQNNRPDAIVGGGDPELLRAVSGFRPSSAAQWSCASPPTCPMPASPKHSTARRMPPGAASTRDFIS